MKILRLQLENLTSFRGKVEIPLDSGPLSEGLFAITGPTGSGKSTLLDALCVALYNRTPRLSGRSDVQVGHAEADDAHLLGNNDPRALLRHGAGEGMAQVDFLGHDGHRYRATWQVRRARGKATGRLQPSKLSLLDLDTEQVLGGTATETLQATALKVGLSYDQFCRAVLLAQGDFAAFLRAGANERAALLEAMTNTHIYRRISILSFERARAAREQVEALESRLGDELPMDPDARSALETRRGQHVGEEQRVRRQLDTLEASQRWYDERHKLEQRVVKARAQSTATQAAHTEAAPRREALARAERAQSHIVVLERHDTLTDELDGARSRAAADTGQAVQIRREAERLLSKVLDAETRLTGARQAASDLQPEMVAADALDKELVRARAEHDAHKERHQQAQQAHRSTLQAIELHQGRAEQVQAGLSDLALWTEQNPQIPPVAQDWGRVRDRLQQAIDAQRALNAADEARPALLDAAARATSNEGKLAEQHDTLSATLETHRESLATQRQALSELDGEAIHQQSLALEQAIQRRRVLEELHGRLTDTQRRAATARALAERRTADAHTAAERILGLQQQMPPLSARLDEARGAVQRTREALSLDARRHQLVTGQPCPLCGATEHPWSGQGPVPELLSEQQERVEQLDAEHGALQAALVEARGEQRAAEGEVVSAAEAQADAETNTSTLLIRWAELALALPHAPRDPEATEAADRLARLRTEQESERQRLRALRTRHGELLGLADQLEDQLSAARRSLEASATRMQQAHEQVRSSTEDCARNAAAIDAARTRLHASLDAIAGTFQAWQGWRTAALEDTKALLDQCQAATRLWAEQRAAGRQLEAERTELTTRIQDNTQLLGAQERILRQATDDASASRAALTELERQRAALLDGRPVVELRASLQEKTARARAELDSARELAAASERARAAAESTAKAAVDRVTELDAGLAAQRGALEAVLTRLGWSEADLRAHLSHAEGWLERERGALDQLEKAADEAALLLQERSDLLAEHEGGGAPSIPAAELTSALADAAQARAELEAARQETELALRRDEERRERQAELGAELVSLQAEHRRWQVITDLIGQAKGDLFQRFAQGLTLEILLEHANENLGMLKPRYALQRVPRTDMDLQVVDRHMADEVRPLGSLSGGETFLVSLALALGLSSLSSTHLRVDSLFIDEGFGTLDPRSLEDVIGALEQLQASGRSVGVISHVEALAERLGTRLAVIPVDPSRSRVAIRGPLGLGEGGEA